jgi:hypothetical protein
MLVHRLLLFVKFLGLCLYVGGATAALLSGDAEARRRAAHAVASPGMLVTWTVGWLLASETGVALTELWTAGGLTFSFVSQIALVRAASRPHSVSSDRWLVGLPLVATLACMIFRPTWASLRG